MRIEIQRDSNIPMYIQIKNQIQEMIFTKVLPAGYVLPPERKLAEAIDVNRSTVLRAYQELKADGLIESHIGRGTIVLPQNSDDSDVSGENVRPILWYQFFKERPNSPNVNVIRDVMEIASKEKIISFAAGMPSPDLYPVNEIKEIQRYLLENAMENTLIHTSVEGYYPLRESICELQESRGIYTSPKEIMILSGSQQGLDFAARLFLSPGDIVIVEEPTYLGAIKIFSAAGARLMSVPLDHQGMRMDILQSLLTRYKPKLIYTLPTFQNPSGTVMSLERRHQLLELAYRYQVPILEDDPYGEIRFNKDKFPPLKALDRHGYVIYLSTFSKTMFMGLRIGWVAAPQQIIGQFSVMKQMTDLQANTMGQLIFDQFLRMGFYSNHIQRVSEAYKKRRDKMLDALKKYNTINAKWEKPVGGFYLWFQLPEGITASRLLLQASKKGVAFIPGEAFYPDSSRDKNYIRLNFSYPNFNQIEEGIKRLMKAAEEMMREDKVFDHNGDDHVKPLI